MAPSRAVSLSVKRRPAAATCAAAAAVRRLNQIRAAPLSGARAYTWRAVARGPTSRAARNHVIGPPGRPARQSQVGPPPSPPDRYTAPDERGRLFLGGERGRPNVHQFTNCAAVCALRHPPCDSSPHLCQPVMSARAQIELLGAAARPRPSRRHANAAPQFDWPRACNSHTSGTMYQRAAE